MAAMSHAAVRRALQPREVSSLAWAFGTLRRLVGYGVEGTLVRDGVEGVIWMGSCWCRGESSEREGCRIRMIHDLWLHLEAILSHAGRRVSFSFCTSLPEQTEAEP